MSKLEPEIIDGIECYCANVNKDHQDYPASGLDNLYRSENRHFWFISRREYIVDIFNKYISKEKNIIEIGAGTGSIARGLMAAGYSPAVGELHLSGLRYAKSYGINKCYQFDLYDPPFQSQFDVVGMFDVLEHLDNAVGAMRQVNRMLADNGMLVMTVPAHMWLWNQEDRNAGHKTRYTNSTLQEVLELAEFDVVEMRYFFIFIMPLLWLRKLIHTDQGTSTDAQNDKGEITINPLVNKILLGMCRFESRIRMLLPNSIGGSLMVVARKL